VTPEGSTHVNTFTGTTPSFSRTASERVAVVAVVRLQVFGAGCGWPRTKSGWKPSEVSMGSTPPSGAAQAAGSLDDGNLLPGLLGSVQQDLLVVGTELMAPSREVPARTCPRLAREEVTRLEAAIEDPEVQAARVAQLRRAGRD
jgi:hypothetical protein